MSGQRKSWVSRRVADLEARSTPKASSSAPSPSVSLKTRPVYQREHRQPPPRPSEKRTTTPGVPIADRQPPPRPSEKRTTTPGVTIADRQPPPHPSEKRTTTPGVTIADRQPPPHPSEKRTTTPGVTIAARDMTVGHRLADQADIMAKRITDLEAALATSGRRIARLSTAATAAATAPCHTRHADQAIAAAERCCATRVGQLEDALMQAEKRASWLQEELKVVWACGAQRVRELETAARQQGEGEEKRHFPGRSSGEESGEGMDKMDGTREALSGLRTRFYRVMRERNKLKSRCDHLSENLGKLNDNAPPPPQNREPEKDKDNDNKDTSNQNGGCATRDKSRCGVPAPPPAKSGRAPASGVDDMCSWRWSPPERSGGIRAAVPRGE